MVYTTRHGLVKNWEESNRYKNKEFNPKQQEKLILLRTSPRH